MSSSSSIANDDRYDLKELADLKPVDSKYFVCKQCGFPNLVGERELMDIFLSSKKQRAQVHFECEAYIAMIMKKLKVNFGTYENMFLHLINTFYSANTSSSSSIASSKQSSQQSSQSTGSRPIQPEFSTKEISTIPSGENKGNDSSDGKGN